MSEWRAAAGMLSWSQTRCLSVKNLFSKNSILVVLGPGGVGKTTVSAALGIAAAQAGLATGVITVDPARRLRDALGIRQLGGAPRALNAERLSAAGLDPRLGFAALALDVKRTWDELLGRLLPDRAARAKLIENSFYRNLTENFAGAESYAALEELLALHEGRRFACVIVDTPPAEHVFDFVEAPAHLRRLLDSPSARWIAQLSQASRLSGLRIANRAGRLVLEQLEKFAGARPLSSIADFLTTAAEASGAIVHRMRQAEALLRSEAVDFVLVTTPAADRLNEALEIAQRMKKERLRLSAVVINRATCGGLGDVSESTLRGTLPELSSLRASLDNGRPADTRLSALLDSVTSQVIGQLDANARIAAFARRVPASIALIQLPERDAAIRDLRGLAQLAEAFSQIGSRYEV